MMAFDAMLSRILKRGLNPLLVRWLIFSLNTLIIVSSFVFGIASAKILFELQSYMMNIVTISSIDLTGNLPVQSIYVVPSFVSICIVQQKISFIFSSFCFGVMSSAAAFEFNHSAAL